MRVSSRGWGFASPDSDYDVRFVYVNRLDWYLTVEPGRDVIEQPISGELDVNGWDLRKALKLLHSSNPVLFLYEALELIDFEEHRMSVGRARSQLRRSRRAAPAAPARKLTYEAFIRARAPGTAPDQQPTNSLATSYANEVRAALNALLGIDEARLEAIDGEADADVLALDAGDDTADGDDAIEGGAEPVARDALKRAAVVETMPAQSVVDTEEAIASAVHRFNEQLAAAARSRPLTSRDLLRVRVLLAVVLCSGTTKTVRRTIKHGERSPILLSRGDRGWRWPETNGARPRRCSVAPRNEQRRCTV